jgi:hypothetical protein
MKTGNIVKLKKADGDIDETLWEIVGFKDVLGVTFVLLKHPELGGTFSFHKQSIVEIVCK